VPQRLEGSREQRRERKALRAKIDVVSKATTYKASHAAGYDATRLLLHRLHTGG